MKTWVIGSDWVGRNIREPKRTGSFWCSFIFPVKSPELDWWRWYPKNTHHSWNLLDTSPTRLVHIKNQGFMYPRLAWKNTKRHQSTNTVARKSNEWKKTSIKSLNQSIGFEGDIASKTWVHYCAIVLKCCQDLGQPPKYRICYSWIHLTYSQGNTCSGQQKHT